MASAYRRPLLVSAWPNRVISDAVAALAWPASVLVLQPDNRSYFQCSFLAALSGREPWPAQTRAIVGRSITVNLHEVAGLAIAKLLRDRTGEPPIGTQETQGDSEAKGQLLADWLAEVTSDAHYNMFKQLPYLFTSGALRARAIATALQHVQHRPFERAIDIGSGVGMIPWLLGHDLPLLRSIELLEPKTQFWAAADRLWRDFPGTYSVPHATAEQAEYRAADLIMFSHSLLLIAPEQRQAVLEHAWNILRPGGVLLVNEIFHDASVPNPVRPDLIHRDELARLMPDNSHIFTRRTGWRRPENIASVTARRAGHTGVILAVRQ